MHATNVLHRHPHRCRALALALLLAAAGVDAAEAPAPAAWSRAKFDYVAQRQDLRQVLRDFARALRVQLDLADEVQGSVTGRFDMAPPVLLDMLGAFHGFVWHFDGAVLYVGSSKPGAPKMRLRPRTTEVSAKAAAAPTAPTAHDALAPTAAAASAATHGAAPAAPRPLPGWTVRLEDGTLGKTFARWAQEAGWQLIWEMPVDFRIDAATRIEGEFEQAVTSVADSMAGAETPMQVVLYHGNRVIRVISKGNP